MEYLKKDRENMFPEIKDFRDPQDHLRNSHPKDLSMGDWIWFHPKAYTLVKIGTPAMFLSIFLYLIIYSTIKANYFINTLSLIMGIIMLYLLIKEIHNYPLYKNTNLYDIYIRDVI